MCLTDTALYKVPRLVYEKCHAQSDWRRARSSGSGSGLRLPGSVLEAADDRQLGFTGRRGPSERLLDRRVRSCSIWKTISPESGPEAYF